MKHRIIGALLHNRFAKKLARGIKLRVVKRRRARLAIAREKRSFNMIIPTAPFNMTQLLGGDWSVNMLNSSDTFVRDKYIDFSEVGLLTCLRRGKRKGERYLSGREKLERLRAVEQDGGVLADAAVFMGLWADYLALDFREGCIRDKQIDDKSVLELMCKRMESKCICLEFFGHIFIGPDGRDYVLCLYGLPYGIGYWTYEPIDDVYDVARQKRHAIVIYPERNVRASKF